MTTKTDSYPKIGKKVMLDIERHQRSAFLLASFQSNARNNNWTDQEIETVFKFLVGKPYDEQLEILNYYCIPPLFEEEEINHEDVVFMLNHLGLETHYLGSKPLDMWDEYDRSNYHSLKRKATSRIRRVFAYFAKDVEEKHKYTVDSPPAMYYESREEAEANLTPLTLETVNIYALWIQE